MESADKKNDTEITDTDQELSDEKEMSCLAKLGIFVLVVAVISAIVVWISFKVRNWKNFVGMVRQADEGTFWGNHSSLVIGLVIAVNVILVLALVSRWLKK